MNWKGPAPTHSNQDLFDRVQLAEVKYNAVVLAALVYRTAMRDERGYHAENCHRPDLSV
jgi:hypothetical protein